MFGRLKSCWFGVAQGKLVDCSFFFFDLDELKNLLGSPLVATGTGKVNRLLSFMVFRVFACEMVMVKILLGSV